MDLLSPNCSLAEFMTSDAHIRGYENVVAPSGMQGRCLPLKTLTRDLQAGINSAGGALVTSGVSDEVVSPLRQVSALGKAGARFIPRSGGPISFPVLGDFAQATWSSSEIATIPETDLSVSLALANPHAVSIACAYSRLVDTQSQADFSAMLAREALAKIGCEIDRVGLVGNGVNGQATGILNTPTGTVTWGGPPTWSILTSIEQVLGNANGEQPGASLCYILSPDTRQVFKNTQKFAGASVALMEDDGTINGRPSVVTTELNSSNGGNRVIYGDFKKVYVVLFNSGNLFVVKNPFSRAHLGEEIATFTMWVDVGLVQTVAMVCSTDSGAI